MLFGNRLKFGLIASLLWVSLSSLSYARGGNDMLQAGPMMGYMDVMEALIWVQTKSTAKVEVRYWTEDGKRQVTDPMTTDHLDIAKVIVTDLKPETLYHYDVLINGKAIKVDYPLKFKTRKLWLYRTDAPDFKFMFGSCLYANDAPFDRPGEPYGSEHEILGVMAKQDVEFMLWTGDTFYYREADLNSLTRMKYRIRYARSQPQLQPLLAAFPHYATWDDHDYGPNDSNRIFPLKHEALDLFKAYWNNPHFGFKDHPGVYGTFEWGDAQFFLLDNRFHRAPNRSQDPDKAFLGKKQLDWFKDALVSSRSNFKFVVFGNQVVNHLSSHEAYATFSNEYREFMEFMNTSRVSGVVILSGDRHFSDLMKMERTDSYPLYEYTCSPVTAGAMNRFPEAEENSPLRVPGTAVVGKHNFGTVEITGPRGERVLTLRNYDKDGNKLWEHVIPRSELTWPRP